MIKISVIIPVYNAEKTLKKCLDSILNQSLKEIEIILINDGSKDKSDGICQNYVKKDTRILYINKSNEGCSITRNLGIDIAKGKYITFVDSDDYLEKEMYKSMYNIAKKDNSDIVVCGFNILDEKYNHLEKVRPAKYLDKMEYFKIKNKCFNSPWNKIYKKELLKNNNIYFPKNTHMGEDLVFNVKAFYFAEKIDIVKECYYNYYNNLFGAMNNVKKRKEIYISLNEIFNFFNKYDKNNKYLKIYNEFFIFNGIFPIYGIIENLKCQKKEEWKELLILARKNIDKNYKNFSIKEKSYVFYSEVRLKLYFLKPILKKLLRRK